MTLNGCFGYQDAGFRWAMAREVFLISDFGDIWSEVVRAYKESDLHLLCGASSRLFEVAEFADGLKTIKSVKSQILTYAPNHDCGEFFNSAITGKPAIIRPVGDMLDFKTNELMLKDMIEGYTLETSERL